MSNLASGSIQLILGPMFSGKSSELLRRLRRYEHAAKKCIAINYYQDNRYEQDECVATHDKITRQAVKTNRLTKLLPQLANFEVIGIDEGQFFPDISQVSQELANQGKIIIVAALDSTFERKPFENIIHMVPLAQTLIKLTAVCVFCYKQASFTLRTTPSKQVELIGGKQIYKPVCRKCYNFYNLNR